MGTPSVPNGIVSQQNVTKVFYLTCLDGYHSTQGNEIRCIPSGNWTYAECNPVGMYTYKNTINYLDCAKSQDM